MIKFRLLVAIICVNLTLLTSAASQTLITVVDQNNTPLANAVIEYLAAESTVSKATPQNNNPIEAPIYIMDQVNKAFLPNVLVVPKDSQVSFPNSDDIRHHVYSFSAAKTFELKLYAGKPKSPVLFDQEGVVVMGCNIHDSMVGYIYVSAQKNTYLTNEKGTVLIDSVLPESAQLQVWHANAKRGVNERQTIPIDKGHIKDGKLTIKIEVNAPESGDSFEDLVNHAH